MASVLSPALRRWPVIVVLLAMAGFTGVCLREAWLDAPTLDEPVYVAAGLLGAVHHDLSFNDEHPPLPKIIAALPVLAAAPSLPGKWAQASGHKEVGYAARFTRAQLASGKLRAVTFDSRLVPILEALATGLILYRLGSLVFRPAAGAVAAVLWLANPVTIGLGHLDGVDLPLALAAALTSLALLRWLRRRDRLSLVLTGAAAGTALAAGVTGLAVGAAAGAVVTVAAGMAAGPGWAARAGHVVTSGAVIALMALAVLWVSYAVFDPAVLLHPVFLVLPQPYLDGLRFLQLNDGAAGWAYLLGREWNGRQWWYWPASLLVKTPLPTLALLVAGPLALFAVPRRARREVTLTVALPALALAAFTLFTPPDTGIRYLLPVIALLMVVSAGVVLTARSYADRAALSALVAASVVMAASSFPNSLAWTTPPFTPGYRFASSSNVDWGQGFYLLRSWMRTHHRPFVEFHAGWGLGPVALRGARPLPSAVTSKITGWVAVSATLVTGRGNTPPAWLRGYCPVGTLGGSVLIYRLRRSPDRSLPVPPRPAGLCRSSGYSYRAVSSPRD